MSCSSLAIWAATTPPHTHTHQPPPVCVCTHCLAISFPSWPPVEHTSAHTCAHTPARPGWLSVVTVLWGSGPRCCMSAPRLLVSQSRLVDHCDSGNWIPGWETQLGPMCALMGQMAVATITQSWSCMVLSQEAVCAQTRGSCQQTR